MSVGKTCILSRYHKGVLPKTKTHTIGVEFATKIVTLNNGLNIKAQIWDTAGSEKYRAMTAAHYRKAVGAILVYDITNLESFNNVQKWAIELKSLAEPDVVIILVGNKADLNEARKINTEEGRKFAQQNDMLFYETSAFTGLNIKEAFEDLLSAIVQVSKDRGNNGNTNIGIILKPGEDQNVNKPGCFC